MNIHRNFGPVRSYRAEPHSDWNDDPIPMRTSYQIELAAAAKRRWMRRLTMTGTVVVFGAVFALWLLGAMR